MLRSAVSKGMATILSMEASQLRRRKESVFDAVGVQDDVSSCRPTYATINNKKRKIQHHLYNK